MPQILVVDDSTTVRQQLRLFLQDNGHEVLEGNNGKEGFEQARDNTGVKLMIVDVNMPVMNGLEMVAEVRKLPEHAKTPIFMLTTESGTDIAAEGRRVGVTAWIVKPFKPAILLKGIENETREACQNSLANSRISTALAHSKSHMFASVAL